MRGLQQGFHAALLAGVSPEEDPWRAAAICLQAEEGQAVRVRGLRLHGPYTGGPVPARQRRPPWQRLPEENLQKTRSCSANQTEPHSAEELQRGGQGRVTRGSQRSAGMKFTCRTTYIIFLRTILKETPEIKGMLLLTGLS